MTQKLFHIIIVLTIILIMLGCTDSLSVKSPDESIVFNLLHLDNGELNYTVDKQGHTLLNPSRLQMMVDNDSLGKNVLKVNPSGTKTTNERYSWHWIHSEAINHYNSRTFEIIEESGTNWFIETRIFNDGIAFRYIIPGDKDDRKVDEFTTFRMDGNNLAWSQHDPLSYEGIYKKNLVKNVANGTIAGPPITIKSSSGIYLSITEANLKNYHGMILRKKDTVTYQVDFVQELGKIYEKLPLGLPENRETRGKIIDSGPFVLRDTVITPWRVLLIAPDLNTLVNSDILHNLNEPSLKEYFPKDSCSRWIRYGWCAWSWIGGSKIGEPKVSFFNMKDYVKAASELGFEYVLVDEGWSQWGNESVNKWAKMKELVDYAKKQNVRVWVWKATYDRNGVPNIYKPENRQAFFRKCKMIGVAGVKVDFIRTEKPEAVSFYEETLKDAAEYELMIVFHGCNKPTGRNRTWPNLIAHEAVYGMEHKQYGSTLATILPFTRFLAGPADFTPMVFHGNKLAETSWAYQIASSVILSSPLMIPASHPDDILANPAVELIQNIPATWDETIVLPVSEIGKLAAFARRKDTTWFLAIINNDKYRKLTLPLSFLESSAYHLSSFMDNTKNAKSYTPLNRTVRENDSIQIYMRGNGGFVAQFIKIEE